MSTNASTYEPIMPSNIFINRPQNNSEINFPPPNPKVGAFHRTLPHYNPTPLVSLPELAKELGIGQLLLKNESSRFGLPAFKILGGSWATAQVIAKKLELQAEENVGGEAISTPDISLEQLAKAAKNAQLTLYAATDGSHGRAVSRMATYLGISARIFVPTMVDEEVIRNIRSEGSTVEVCDGDYDQTVLATKRAAEAHPDRKGLLISDTALEIGDETPQWMVDGYQTLFNEVEDQITGGKTVTHVITPVGVGSLAQAVATFFRRKSPSPKIITVEPEAAACLRYSLEAGKSTTAAPGYTICTGMCCGTLSAIAWPILKEHVNIALTVDDLEVDKAVKDLGVYNIHAGPCGAASLAAARRLVGTENFNSKASVLILCTEGERPYEMKPKS
ncbi:Diaminopropionate ammonia-lyase [Lachnellula suecica]|uniref:Diaminopropionate ammonia-lyase n=1 Tax=Lachnellula suecica TaxID=602035 RepID=A0A8T9C9F3_9HELO|nr:Diaminopropionate ammonia-lyase [Lachnellula suecica]